MIMTTSVGLMWSYVPHQIVLLNENLFIFMQLSTRHIFDVVDVYRLEHANITYPPMMQSDYVMKNRLKHYYCCKYPHIINVQSF